jgi:monofunctional glycosyltransferase
MAVAAQRRAFKQEKSTSGRRPRRFFHTVLLLPVMLLATYYGGCAFLLLLYNVFPPLTTGVQIQRFAESLFEEQEYDFRYNPTSLANISDDLEHAVVAAEDGRFYRHGGVDWEALQQAMEDNRRRGRMWRGGSTITQQLVKNLFMTTHSSLVRKALEFPLAYMAEILLSKERILYLYLNVIEWGRGVYGAEAAAQRYFGTSSAELSRYQAASLAAIIPSPRSRMPQRMGGYTNTILLRMRQMGW